MEFLTLILTLIIIVPLTFPFIVTRFAIYCLAFYLKRYSITLSVAKCGLFSFRTITISLPVKCTNSDAKDAEDDSKQSGNLINDASAMSGDELLIIKIDNLRFTSLYLDNSCTSILSICLNNTIIQCPESGNGPHSKELRIRTFEFPIDKIRGDFIKHYKNNFNISLSEIVIPSKNINYEIQQANIRRVVSSQHSLLITLNHVTFSDLSIPEVQTFSEKLDDSTKNKILFITQLEIDHTTTHQRVISLKLNGDCFLKCNLEFYLNLIDLINSMKNLVKNLRQQNTSPIPKHTPDHGNEHHELHMSAHNQSNPVQVLNLKLILSGRLQIGVVSDENRMVCAETSALEIEASFPGPKTLHSDLICVSFDEQATLALAMVSISYYPSPGLNCILDRRPNSCGYKLSCETNALLNIDIETVNISFPYKYNFAEAFNEKLMGLIKWIKKYHKKPNRDRKPDEGPIDFDIGLRVNKITFEIEDDPFEIRIRTNYMLLEDEYHEQLKRDQTLQEKINELKRTNLMLASSIVEELNRALAKKNSDIYIQRSKQLYSSETRHVPLFAITIDEADLKILADASFHKHDDIKSIIVNLNPECPPPTATEFSTIWCRILSANFKSVECSLRDFTLPMLSMKDLTFKGMILGTEQVANSRAKRVCEVYVGRNSKKLTVERSMTPLKIFHNLQIRCTKGAYTHGPCWEPVLQQVSLAFEDIISASSDPSPSLPWWDKMRFIFHGQLKLNCNHLSVFLHASNNPYNHTELIELNLSRALIDWITGKVRIKGDFDVLLRTASKYDECRFIRIPNFDSTVNLEWNCLGNPHDHLSVTPCAPDKVPDYSSHLSHDSYRSFRSHSLNLSLNLETQFTSPTSSMSMESMPSMLFFGSTVRWLENQKFIFVGPSKLTRRGKLFNNTKPKKPSLSRIFKEIKVNISLNRFQILYWSSVSKRHGIHVMGGHFSHSSEHSLKLVTDSHDGLKHRPLANWQTVYMNSSSANVEVWLYNLGFEDLDEFNEFNVQANYKNRQYFVSFSKVSYNKEAQLRHPDPINDCDLSMSDQMDGSVNTDVQSTKSDDQIPNHRLVVHDLKAAWTKENRDVIVGIFDAFVNSQQLKRNLSTEALKPIRIEPTTAGQSTSHQQNNMTSNSPPNRHQRHPSTTSLIIINQQNQVSSISKNRAVSMLQKLIADSENNPNVYTEESHSGVASETHLYGVEACQMDDVVDINCLVELVNSQVMLCGTETSGYVIVSAANTEIRQATHLPVWKNKTLLSKTTWTGSLRCMQYYATVDGQGNGGGVKTTFTSEQDIQWLEPDNIDSRSVIFDYPDLVGSGHSVGGVVSSIVGKLYRSNSDECSETPVQLQRIISRCNCLFYYASHTVGVPDDMQHLIPPLPDDEMFIDPWDKEVGVDSFTLTHQDLDISTNSQQYAMIMDVINNLLLFVEPHKKTAFEKLERMRFRFQLSADEDQREPISQLQDQVRKYVAYLKRLERERYLIYRASIGASIDGFIDDLRMETESDRDRISDRDRAYRMSLSSLSGEISTVKEQLNMASEELAMMISCYKEIQLGAHKAQKQQQAASQQGTGAFFANVIRRNEICFKSARWRVTDSDGQLGLADIVLSNFLYSKVVKSDDSVEHTIELGHLHVSNLIPNQAYKDVLHPTELQANIPLDRHRALRIYCRELAPVAGIPVKEHLEINVVPFTIEVTLQFFQKMVKFFFPERDTVKDAKRTSGLDLSGEHQFTRFGSKKRKDTLAVPEPDDSISTVSTTTMNSTSTVSSLNSAQRRGEEIEKMRERAAKNHTFVYVKIPGIPIKVSYKGKKQKSVTDLKNMSLTLPTYEYHNSTWTWLDLFMAVKNDSKHTVIKQALKQKMKIRPSSIWSKSTSSENQLQASDKETTSKEKCTTPVTDEDKARLLLGNYAKKWIRTTSGSPQNETDTPGSNLSVSSNVTMN